MTLEELQKAYEAQAAELAKLKQSAADAAKLASENEELRRQVEARGLKISDYADGEIKRAAEKRDAAKAERDAALERAKAAEEAAIKAKTDADLAIASLKKETVYKSTLLQLGIPADAHKYVLTDIPMDKLELDDAGNVKPEFQTQVQEWLSTSIVGRGIAATVDPKHNPTFRALGQQKPSFIDEKGNVDSNALHSLAAKQLAEQLKGK
jgi:hypothetical protein